MDTNDTGIKLKGVAIWVKEGEPYPQFPSNSIVFGTPFDGAWGFGDDNIEEYFGLVAFISLESKRIQSAKMSLIHRFSKGYGWVVKTETIPEPPFLITDKLDARIIYNGLIGIEPTPGTMEELEESEGFVSYPVASQDWFGILTYEGTNRIHLLAFSDKEALQ